MARSDPEFVMGFVGSRRFSDDPSDDGWIVMSPGVNLGTRAGTDALAGSPWKLLTMLPSFAREPLCSQLPRATASASSTTRPTA